MSKHSFRLKVCTESPCTHSDTHTLNDAHDTHGETHMHIQRHAHTCIQCACARARTHTHNVYTVTHTHFIQTHRHTHKHHSHTHSHTYISDSHSSQVHNSTFIDSALDSPTLVNVLQPTISYRGSCLSMHWVQVHLSLLRNLLLHVRGQVEVLITVVCKLCS